MNIEKKLAAYRAKKERETKMQYLQMRMTDFFSYMKSPKKIEELLINEVIEPEDECLPQNNHNLLPPEEKYISEGDVHTEPEWRCTLYDQVYYLLCFMLWAILYIIFVQIEFGTVYFILSIIIIMYLNTRTTPKRSGEVSAYSVFNKNCESIDGTLKAEQFEREIRFGPASVR